MEPYKTLYSEDPQDVVSVVRDIVRAREQDVKDYENLPSRFISGRSVSRVPSSSADVLVTDRIGDASYDNQYVYYLIDNAGTAEWRRINLHSF